MIGVSLQVGLLLRPGPSAELEREVEKEVGSVQEERVREDVRQERVVPGS